MPAWSPLFVILLPAAAISPVLSAGRLWGKIPGRAPESIPRPPNRHAMIHKWWRGVRFLDPGCGIGRNNHWPMTYGATGGTAIDADDRTLEQARGNLADHPSVTVERCSIDDTPPGASFDIAFSIGVVHHLGQLEPAVRAPAAAVRPGGRVLVWLNGRENNGWIIYLFKPIRRALFSRLPLSPAHALSGPLTAVVWLLLRIGFGRSAYFDLILGFSFRRLRAMVFDHMIPTIARYYTWDAAIALLTQAG